MAYAKESHVLSIALGAAYPHAVSDPGWHLLRPNLGAMEPEKDLGAR